MDHHGFDPVSAAQPYFLWEVIFPPAIDITAFKDRVDYEFFG